MNLPIALSLLPKPQVIEELSFETVITELMADVEARFTARGIAYDAGTLETDTARIILEAGAFRETMLRARINDGGRANLLAFSKGANLEHLAAFHELERLEGEEDEGLAERIQLANLARSTGSTEHRYELAARNVSARIIGAKAFRPGAAPVIHIGILTSDNDGIPDAGLLADVQAAVAAKGTKAINDVVVAVAAVRNVVDVSFDVWLRPEASYSIVGAMPAALEAAWAAFGRIGDDLALSWLTARLHGTGVSRVEITAPLSTVIAGENEALAIGTVTPNYRGVTR